MSKKIILILAPKYYYEIDKYKFEIEEFENQKDISIELHELVEFTNPTLIKAFPNRLEDKSIKTFSTYSEWAIYLKKMINIYSKNNILIFNLTLPTHNLNSFKVNYLIKKKLDVPVIEFFGNDVPMWEKPFNKNVIQLKFFLKIAINIIKYPKKIIIIFKSLFFNYLYKIIKINPKYNLIFGKKNIDKIDKRKNKTVVIGNSLDQNLFFVSKSMKPTLKIDYDYALFLESATPIFSGDSATMGLAKDSILTVENWTKSLKLFFDFLEKEFKFKILISPHPKAKHIHKYPAYYFGREVLNDYAYRFSSKAKLIITRYSSGVSNAVLNNVPVMFIYSDEIKKKSNLVSNQIFFSQQLDKSPINIDDYDKNLIKMNALTINKDKYKNYKENYLTLRSDEVKNSEIFINLLKKQQSKNV